MKNDLDGRAESIDEAETLVLPENEFASGTGSSDLTDDGSDFDETLVLEDELAQRRLQRDR